MQREGGLHPLHASKRKSVAFFFLAQPRRGPSIECKGRRTVSSRNWHRFLSLLLVLRAPRDDAGLSLPVLVLVARKKAAQTDEMTKKKIERSSIKTQRFSFSSSFSSPSRGNGFARAAEALLPRLFLYIFLRDLDDVLYLFMGLQGLKEARNRVKNGPHSECILAPSQATSRAESTTSLFLFLLRPLLLSLSLFSSSHSLLLRSHLQTKTQPNPKTKARPWP